MKINSQEKVLYFKCCNTIHKNVLKWKSLTAAYNSNLVIFSVRNTNEGYV